MSRTPATVRTPRSHFLIEAVGNVSSMGRLNACVGETVKVNLKRFYRARQ